MIAPPISSVAALEPYVVRVRFEDDEIRDVDIAPLLEGAAFRALRDSSMFAAVRVDEESGSIAWPNGADLDPDVIYGVAEPARKPAALVTTPQTA
jgi:hypothetical protein